MSLPARNMLAVTVFALQTLWGGSAYGPTLWRVGANSRDRVLAGEVWRLFSAAFPFFGNQPGLIEKQP